MKSIKMRPKKIYLLLTLTTLFVFSPKIFAQKDLQISKVFETYGKKKGVVMTVLSGEMLKEYDFTFFKSITIKNDPSAATFIRQCLKIDEEGAKKIKQVVVDGVPASIYLRLPPKGQEHRLILFNETIKPARQLTLIYIESEKDSEDVLNIILKKK